LQEEKRCTNLTKGGDVQSIINKIILVAQNALNCDRVTLYLCHDVKQELVCCVSRDFGPMDKFTLPYGVGLSGYVARKVGEKITLLS